MDERLGSQWPPAGARELDVELLYDRLAETGFGYGPVFQGVPSGMAQRRGIFAEVVLGEEAAAEAARLRCSPRAPGRGAARRPAGVGR